MKQRWTDIVADNSCGGKWLALTDCEYDEDRLEECVVIDSDSNLAALEERLASKGIESCIIKFCGDEPENSENPRITRATLVDKSGK
jgi:hypothetical protein